MIKDFKLHPQLAQDTHSLFDSEDFTILLHKNATIPWIIIVPKTNKTEVYDLPKTMQKSINDMCQTIAAVFKSDYGSEKMNIAAIGNMVPQLHIHAIGRKPGDACWPNVVWGTAYPNKEYTTKQVKHITQLLNLKKSFT